MSNDMVNWLFSDEKGNECELFKADKTLNQFWWEGLLVTKNMLSRTMNRYYGVYNAERIISAPVVETLAEILDILMPIQRLPVWFPPTYDLKIPLELWSFICHYYLRSQWSSSEVSCYLFFVDEDNLCLLTPFVEER